MMISMGFYTSTEMLADAIVVQGGARRSGTQGKWHSLHHPRCKGIWSQITFKLLHKKFRFLIFSSFSPPPPLGGMGGGEGLLIGFIDQRLSVKGFVREQQHLFSIAIILLSPFESEG